MGREREVDFLFVRVLSKSPEKLSTPQELGIKDYSRSYFQSINMVIVILAEIAIFEIASVFNNIMMRYVLALLYMDVVILV